VYDKLFYGEEMITWKYFASLFKKLTGMSKAEVSEYLQPAEKVICGRKRKLSPGSDEAEFLLHLNHTHKSMRLSSLASMFEKEFYGGNLLSTDKNHHVSTTIVRKALKEGGLSRKKIEWRNIRRNPSDQVKFMDEIAYVDPSHLVDIDGMVQNAKVKILLFK
jgi:transposase